MGLAHDGVPRRLRCLLHCAFDLDADSWHAARKGGWRALHSTDRRQPLPTFRQARAATRLRTLAAHSRYVRHIQSAGDGSTNADGAGNPMMARNRPHPGRYFGIGIYQNKREVNIGTLWRGAYQLGAAFIYTIGKRYQPQPADTARAWQHIPLFRYESVEQMIAAAAYDCPLIGIEEGGVSLTSFEHPVRANYLLGAEDGGLPQSVLDRCHHVITIPSVRSASYNVAQAGTIVMYDRLSKEESRE